MHLQIFYGVIKTKCSGKPFHEILCYEKAVNCEFSWQNLTYCFGDEIILLDWMREMCGSMGDHNKLVDWT